MSLAGRTDVVLWAALGGGVANPVDVVDRLVVSVVADAGRRDRGVLLPAGVPNEHLACVTNSRVQGQGQGHGHSQPRSLYNSYTINHNDIFLFSW